MTMFKTNEYFDGKVKSIAFSDADKAATVGVMAAGEYTFNTAEKEKMTVVSGQMQVLLPGESQRRTFSAGESFDVPANSAFEVSVDSDCAYLCIYG